MQLITDRTEGDVLLGTAKGRYNYSDLNRAESAVEALQQMVEQLDIRLDLSTKKDWATPGNFSASTWPTESQMQRFLANVYALCDALDIAANLPQTMSMLTWQGANAIEQALQDTYHRAMGTIDNLRYSGEFFAGEEIYL